MNNESGGAIQLVDGHHGVYVPYVFASNYHTDIWNVKEEDKEILLDSDHELYWETWDEVLNYAHRIDLDGSRWELHQLEGDLYAVCDTLLNYQEYEWLYGEPREVTNEIHITEN